ncbi:MAG: class I SAM-dependent RNA methyltransferase [Kiritimatiellae bacterium]|nr:class I SAM-dependent RNA methyltransferase [Kiritimatiellia bacterium]
MNAIFSGEPSDVVVTCGWGAAPVLSAEIAALGFRVGAVSDTSVETEGTLADCMRLNLHLRTAHRVLYALDRFRARRGDDIYDELVAIPWERYLDPDGYFSVDRAVENPTIRDSRFAALKVKDAVADRMRNACGRRPDSGKERTDACLFLHWAGERASIYLDTTGQSLSFRGYRAESSAAPLRESLAAALVLASGWDRRSPLLNPMCGGGTIAVEALWIAQERPPALLRDNFAFMHLACYEPSLWTDLRGAAIRAFERTRRTPVEIRASDIDAAMVRATLANAAAAGDDAGAIRAETCDVLASPHPPRPAGAAPGVAILNPPYGGRIGDPARLRDLYEDVGGFLAAAAADGYRGFVFTGNPELADAAGLRAERSRRFYSGDLACTLLEEPALDEAAARRFARRHRAR